jgi:Flp pilus assembly protein TadD
VSNSAIVDKAFFVAILLLGLSAPARAQMVQACGDLHNAYGPYDYSDPAVREEKLRIVENFHLTPNVEQLRGGATSTIAGDLDYVLRASPNHYRALVAISKLRLANGSMRGANYSVECYFDRAMRFRPEDATVRMLFANYLFKKGDKDGARDQYETALRLSPTAPEVNYDAGLFYFAIGEYARARELAKIAYDGGYPLPGLKKKLQQAGHWNAE